MGGLGVLVRRWGGGIEVQFVSFADDFEDVALVDGFSAVETEGKRVLVFLVVNVFEKAFLAGAVPAACYGWLDHWFFGADRAFVAGFRLDLQEDVSTEFICNVLVSGISCETFNELLQIHIIGQTVSDIRCSCSFLFLRSNGLVAGKDWMTTRLPETKNLSKDGSI